MKRMLSLLVICVLLCAVTACGKAKTPSSTTTASTATATTALESQSTTTETTIEQQDELGTVPMVSTTSTTTAQSAATKAPKKSTTTKKTTATSAKETDKKPVATTVAATTAKTTTTTITTTTTTTAKPTTTTTKIPSRVYQTDTFRIEIPTYLDGEYQAWVDNTWNYFLQSVEAEYGYVYLNLSVFDENNNLVNKQYNGKDFIIYIRHSENRSWGKDTVETYSPEALVESMAKGIVFSMKDGLSAVVGCEYEENGNLGGLDDPSTCTVDWPKELEYIISTFEWL